VFDLTDKSICLTHSDATLKERHFDEVIVNKKTLDDITIDVREAILEYNSSRIYGPRLYRSNGSFCRLAKDDNGTTIIQPLDTLPLMTNELLKVCRWMKYNNNSDRNEPTDPPRKIVENLMSEDNYLGISPTLIGTTDLPPIDDNGNVQSVKGYNNLTRLYYDGSIMLDIPNEPSDADIEDAKTTIEDIFADFPFKKGAHNVTHAYTMLITAVLRPSIKGNVPFHAINKAQPGVGASLITDVVSLVATGKNTPVCHYKNNDEEIEKLILASLRERPQLIIFDNITGLVDSATLSSLATASTFKGRELGKSKTLSLINTASVILNGIAISYSYEVTRRVVEIYLETEHAEYWRLNKTFRHPDLRSYVLSERKKIIAAIYTLYRAWVQRGCCNMPPTLADFDEWVRIMNGICSVAGWEGLLTRPTDEDGAYDDPGTSQWREFINALYKNYGDKPFTVKDIITQLDTDTDDGGRKNPQNQKLYQSLPDELADAHDRKGKLNTILGQNLNKYKRRNFGDDIWLVKLTTKASGNKTQFKIEQIEKQGTLNIT
jgi:hypothetical protein